MAAWVDGRLAAEFVPHEHILIPNKTTDTPKTGSYRHCRANDA
jgi:hypothetical protein